MANVSALATATTAATALSNLILATPQSTLGYQPQNQPGTTTLQQPPSFMFHYEGEQTVSLESDITDHYVEDNTAIQDQISIKPPTITTHGFIGELNDVPPALLAPLQTVADKLLFIGAYTPTLTASALIAYNEATLLYNTAASAASSAVSAWASLSGSGGESVINGQGITKQSNQNKQQTFFQQFYGYWQTRTLFTVQTPWAVFQNMAIRSLRAVQGEDTRVITDFEVTFKLIRFASAVSVLPTKETQGRLTDQSSSTVNNGVQTPTSSIPLSQAIA